AVWMVSLLLAVIGIAFRHFPHLVHVVRELLGAPQSHIGQASAAVVTLSPAVWGLGAIPTATLFSGLASFRFGKREVGLVVVFLVSALGAVEPHFNLAQVYTKHLMFPEASREQSRASTISFDRVADFSRWTAPQLNRSVMDADPPAEALWGLSRRFASHRIPSVREGNALIRWVTRLAPPAPFALVF